MARRGRIKSKKGEEVFVPTARVNQRRGGRVLGETTFRRRAKCMAVATHRGQPARAKRPTLTSKRSVQTVTSARSPHSPRLLALPHHRIHVLQAIDQRRAAVV